MLFRGTIIVTSKEGVPNPQGTAIFKQLQSLGFTTVIDVKRGKFFELNVEAEDEKEALAKFEEMADKLLTNSVTEEFRIAKIERAG